MAANARGPGRVCFRPDPSAEGSLPRGVTIRSSRLVVAITGTAALGPSLRFLDFLGASSFERHVVVATAAEADLWSDLGHDWGGPRTLGEHVYSENNQAARISSGSFITVGMTVIPCCTESLASIALGLADNLIHRAADVTLKERRPLLLATLNEGSPSPSTQRALQRLSLVPGATIRTVPEALSEEASFFSRALELFVPGAAQEGTT